MYCRVCACVRACQTHRYMLAYTCVMTILVDYLLARGLVGVVVRAATALNYCCSVGDKPFILGIYRHGHRFWFQRARNYSVVTKLVGIVRI